MSLSSYSEQRWVDNSKAPKYKCQVFYIPKITWHWMGQNGAFRFNKKKKRETLYFLGGGVVGKWIHCYPYFFKNVSLF